MVISPSASRNTTSAPGRGAAVGREHRPAQEQRLSRLGMLVVGEGQSLSDQVLVMDVRNVRGDLVHALHCHAAGDHAHRPPTQFLDLRSPQFRVGDITGMLTYVLAAVVVVAVVYLVLKRRRARATATPDEPAEPARAPTNTAP